MTATPAQELNEDMDIEALHASVQTRVANVFAHFGIPPEDAKDIFQNVWLSYLRHQDSVHAPEGWVISAVRYSCKSYWRERQRRVFIQLDETTRDLLEDMSPPPQEREALRRDIAAQVAQLPYRCRTLLEQRFSLGLKPQESAVKLGYKKSGIYKVLKRCLAALNRNLLACGLNPE